MALSLGNTTLLRIIRHSRADGPATGCQKTLHFGFTGRIDKFNLLKMLKK